MKPSKFGLEDELKDINYFKVLSIFFVMAYLLAACGGTLPQTVTSAKGPKVEANHDANDDKSSGNSSNDGPNHDGSDDNSGSGGGSGNSGSGDN